MVEMEGRGGAAARNWTEVVEDLMHSGEADSAVSFMESTVSNLEQIWEKAEFYGKEEGGESWPAVADELILALKELSKLYSTKGLSNRADEVVSRVLQIEYRKGKLPTKEISTISAHHDGFTQEFGAENDDWEANADRSPEELLSPLCTPGVSKHILTDKESKSYKRRGRGNFVYSPEGMYSDNKSEKLIDDSDDSAESLAEEFEKGSSLYGTSHVLVLADLPLSTRTTDLENLLKNSKDRFVIRWVNETTSLAVFRTPADACEASNTIRFPFPVRILTEDDEVWSSIPVKDLVPPRPRPQTSARTAQRMIAHSMGIRLPSTLGSNEFREQEAARRNRIVSKKNMKDDAWGD